MAASNTGITFSSLPDNKLPDVTDFFTLDGRLLYKIHPRSTITGYLSNGRPLYHKEAVVTCHRCDGTKHMCMGNLLQHMAVEHKIDIQGGNQTLKSDGMHIGICIFDEATCDPMHNYIKAHVYSDIHRKGLYWVHTAYPEPYMCLVCNNYRTHNAKNITIHMKSKHEIHVTGPWKICYDEQGVCIIDIHKPDPKKQERPPDPKNVSQFIALPTWTKFQASVPAQPVRAAAPGHVSVATMTKEGSVATSPRKVPETIGAGLVHVYLNAYDMGGNILYAIDLLKSRIVGMNQKNRPLFHSYKSECVCRLCEPVHKRVLLEFLKEHMAMQHGIDIRCRSECPEKYRLNLSVQAYDPSIRDDAIRYDIATMYFDAHDEPIYWRRKNTTKATCLLCSTPREYVMKTLGEHMQQKHEKFIHKFRHGLDDQGNFIVNQYKPEQSTKYHDVGKKAADVLAQMPQAPYQKLMTDQKSAVVHGPENELLYVKWPEDKSSEVIQRGTRAYDKSGMPLYTIDPLQNTIVGYDSSNQPLYSNDTKCICHVCIEDREFTLKDLQSHMAMKHGTDLKCDCFRIKDDIFLDVKIYDKATRGRQKDYFGSTIYYKPDGTPIFWVSKKSIDNVVGNTTRCLMCKTQTQPITKRSLMNPHMYNTHGTDTFGDWKYCTDQTGSQIIDQKIPNSEKTTKDSVKSYNANLVGVMYAANIQVISRLAPVTMKRRLAPTAGADQMSGDYHVADGEVHKLDSHREEKVSYKQGLLLQWKGGRDAYVSQDVPDVNVTEEKESVPCVQRGLRVYDVDEYQLYTLADWKTDVVSCDSAARPLYDTETTQFTCHLCPYDQDFRIANLKLHMALTHGIDIQSSHERCHDALYLNVRVYEPDVKNETAKYNRTTVYYSTDHTPIYWYTDQINKYGKQPATCLLCRNGNPMSMEDCESHLLDEHKLDIAGSHKKCVDELGNKIIDVNLINRKLLSLNAFKLHQEALEEKVESVLITPEQLASVQPEQAMSVK